MEENVQKALDKLLELIKQDPAITEYKEAEAAVKAQSELMDLVEEIKHHNQEEVNFDYYGLPNAKERAQSLSNQKTEKFEADILVKDYRAALFEANSLLQHITQQLTNQVNEEK